jgi:hypothetical protein
MTTISKGGIKMKPALRLAALGLALSLILAACASQLETPDTRDAGLESSPAIDTKAPDTSEPSNPTTATEGSEQATLEQPEASNPTREPRDYQIITLLPPDAIPSIDNPVFLTVEEADNEYQPDEEILGVVFDGEARAYSVPLLSSHEIVNDTVAGRKIAVTW